MCKVGLCVETEAHKCVHKFWSFIESLCSSFGNMQKCIIVNLLELSQAFELTQQGSV